MSGITYTTTSEITGTTKVETIIASDGGKRIITWLWADALKTITQIEMFKPDGTLQYSWIVPTSTT